jgi:acetyltransferase-like isoleucine patch superfamily enzyme
MFKTASGRDCIPHFSECGQSCPPGRDKSWDGGQKCPRSVASNAPLAMLESGGYNLARRMRWILLKLLTRAGRLWLRMHGAALGSRGWVHGLPEARLTRGSSLQIGNDVTLCSMARFNPLSPGRRLSFITNTAQARIVIKDGAGISNSVFSAFESILVGERTLIGAECLIVDSDFHGLPLGENQPIRSAPVEIGNSVFIGARSIILKGVKIGDGTVIGAGSVVTTNIPARSLAAGNPARVIRAFSTPPAG